MGGADPHRKMIPVIKYIDDEAIANTDARPPFVSSQKKMLPSGLDGQLFPHLQMLPAAGLLSSICCQCGQGRLLP